VLGAQDGLIGTVGLLTGLAVAHESNKYIAIAGIAEMAASSLSMAAGVYLSSQAENDLYRGAIADELAEMEDHPEVERLELQYLLEEEGIPTDDAHTVSKIMARLAYRAWVAKYFSATTPASFSAVPPWAFTTSADAQELWCQEDAGYAPVAFAMGNVAYSIGVGRGITGAFNQLQKGEVKQYSDIFSHTRNLALQRIVGEAQSVGANAVVGITTSILPFGGTGKIGP